MPDDDNFKLTYPCYFLYGGDGGLVCNCVDGNQCLCLFTSTFTLQRFHEFQQRELHSNDAPSIKAPVDVCQSYEDLIGRLKSGEADLAKAGVLHISIDPQQDRPTTYTTIRNFIEDLPRD